jgi:hypothetical protein
MKPLSRRSVTTGIAAAVTAIPAIGHSAIVPKVEPESKLAALLSELLVAEKAWISDDDRIADRNHRKLVVPAERAIVGVPARTAEDALRALDYLIEHDLIADGTFGGYGKMADSLVDAIRGYIASTARVA